MGSLVTSTVAACLKAFEVDVDKYSELETGSTVLPLASVPSNDELAKLIQSGFHWSGSGLLHDTADDFLKDLHCYDFICLESDNKDKLYDIAQIQSISIVDEEICITYERFERVSNREASLKATGELFHLARPDLIKQTCWVGPAGTLYCDFTTASSIELCAKCLQKRKERVLPLQKLRHLRTLSLFGGAGGMDIGLSFTHFRTEWMVDLSQISCKTFSAHHPSTQVIQMPVGDALGDRVELSNMPRMDEVDAIVMGPPCQSFSKFNRQSSEEREKDPRSLCVATGLSYVELYRPTYGIIENVCGILENGNLGTTKRNGIIKFILVCLASLGYNARIGIVECSSYGVPQGRKRFLVLFAKQQVALPRLPTPTHCTKESNGLYPEVTIDDAVADLPKWDVSNPGIYGPPGVQINESRRVVPASYRLGNNGQVRGPEHCSYVSIPQTVFQQRMRCSGSSVVADHYVLPPFESPKLTIERVWNIPFHPNANHLSLSNLTQLALPELLDTTDEAVFKNAFRRLDSNGRFPIVMTTIGLKGKSGRMLMPDQHRLPSIRELARAQSFPDGIRFQGTPGEQLTQIGNAVPVSLAFALGESIVEAMVSDCLQGDIRFLKAKKR